MRNLIRIMLAAVVALTGLTGVSRAGDEDAIADVHTLRTPPLADGQIELLTVSTFPDAVSGGDVKVAVRGLSPDDTVAVSVNGDAYPSPQPGGAAEMAFLVEGLKLGNNEISVTVSGSTATRTAQLEVVNHPISGPIISGPHQAPFRCRTKDVGLSADNASPPLCHAPTKYEWFYFSSQDMSWKPLTSPAGPYPLDVARTEMASEHPGLDGKAVPFIVRLETAVINRGIARIAVLDDPAAHGGVFVPNWNGRVYHSFGESCGVGYDQGRNSAFHVLGGVPDPSNVSADNLFANFVGLHTRLGEGDVVLHSTLTAFGNHCNPMVSMETAMMLKEHITERYSSPAADPIISAYVGTGSSGGALQQYTAANSHPGLLDGAMPGASFADIATTAMTVTDCGLLVNYFSTTSLDWDEAQKAAVTGHNPQSSTAANSICGSWVSSFLDRIDPTRGCSGLNVPAYHPTSNPTGPRCTVQDANVNWLGRDPVTTFARRPLDNVGVQYGLQAFNAGLISFEQFADLNRTIGGYDIDGRHQAARHAMEPEVAAITYRIGQVIGRGALAETPIIDFAPYLDLVPVANIHESARPYVIRERVKGAGGGGSLSSTMAIWRGLVVQSDGLEEMDAWVAALNAASVSADRTAAVAEAKPLTAIDQCALGTVGGRVEASEGVRAPLGIPVTVAPGLPGPDADVALRAFVPEDHELRVGPCAAAMPPVTTTRIAAGGPLSDDVIKCQRKAVDASDYAAALTAEQLSELASIFPEGVCDWTLPSVGDVASSILWPSVGGATPLVDSEGEPAPVGLLWRTARSS